MPVVAAQELGVGSADGISVSADNKLQLVLVHIHHGGAGFLVGWQEEDGKHGHLKLRTDTNESTAHWLDQTMPAELHVQDVIVCIRLMEREQEDLLKVVRSLFSD